MSKPEYQPGKLYKIGGTSKWVIPGQTGIRLYPDRLMDQHFGTMNTGDTILLIEEDAPNLYKVVFRDLIGWCCIYNDLELLIK